MGIKDDMSKMWKAFTGDNEGEEEIVTDAPVTEVVVTESASTEAPGTEAPTTDAPEEFETEAPSTEAVSTEAPTTDIPKESDTDLMAEIERLKNELKEVKEKGPKTSAPATEAPLADEDFLGGLDLDDLSSDPEAFNKVLNAVYRKGLEAAKKTSSESMATLPDMIKENISVIQALERASSDFYEKNKELEPYKDVVATVFGEVASQNPDKTYQENLDLTGAEVRKRLKIEGKKVTKDKPPRLPNPGKQQRPTQKSEPSGFDSELDAMEKALNS